MEAKHGYKLPSKFGSHAFGDLEHVPVGQGLLGYNLIMLYFYNFSNQLSVKMTTRGTFKIYTHNEKGTVTVPK